jgi:MFS family permease
MLTTLSSRLKVLRKAKPVTTQSANFFHLYWDVAWFGVAFGSTLSFLPVFATRLGATGWQLGLLTAGPALVGVLFTLPAGHWIEDRPLSRAVTQTAFWQRLGFLCLIPLPLVLPSASQVWAVLLLMLLMAIPGTALMVGFNALLAATVPPEARGQVVGRRNSLLAATIMLAFVLSGWILDHLSFEWGYAAVFAIGALGAGLSTFHLSRIQEPEIPHFQGRPLQDHAHPGRGVGVAGGTSYRLAVATRLWLNRRLRVGTIFGPISGPYWGVLLAFFLFHFTQWLPTPLFSIFLVREVTLTDGEISWINAAFYLPLLIFSPMLEPLSRRFGNYRLTVIGGLLLGTYPLLVALSYDLIPLIIASIIIGLIWAIMSGSLVNRLLELTPEDHRASHLAIYNMALNVAILLSTMFGPLLADLVGLREALIIVCILRVGSGLALARWG